MQSKFMVPVLALAMAAVSFAANFTLVDRATVAGKKLKTGDYQVSLKKDQAVFTDPDGKTFSIPVKVEQAATKFSNTFVLTKPGSGDAELTEIDLGGSTTRMIFGQ